jgi:hypothetical protein
VHSQYVHPKHPPDKEYCDDGPCDVNYPVASCFRLAKIEHAAMVAGPAHQALYRHPTSPGRISRAGSVKDVRGLNPPRKSSFHPI